MERPKTVAGALLLFWLASGAAAMDREQCIVEAARTAPTQYGLGILIRDCRERYPPSRRECQADADRWNAGPTETFDALTGQLRPGPVNAPISACVKNYRRLYIREPLPGGSGGNFFDRFD